MLPITLLTGSASLTVKVSEDPPCDKKQRLSWDELNITDICIKVIQ
jgi:hypothetical protein